MGILNSIAMIAAGNVSKASAWVETVLAKGLTLLISFLAKWLGLGGIAKKIKAIIETVRKPIDKALDKVVGWIVKKGKALFAKGKGFVGKVKDKFTKKSKKEKDPVLEKARQQKAVTDVSVTVNNLKGPKKKFFGRERKAVTRDQVLKVLKKKKRAHGFSKLELTTPEGEQKVNIAYGFSPGNTITPQNIGFGAVTAGLNSGERTDRIPLDWPKRYFAAYMESFHLMPNKVTSPMKQTDISKRPGAIKYEKDGGKKKIGDSNKFLGGIKNYYKTRENLRVGPNIKPGSRAKYRGIRNAMKAHGYDRTDNSDAPTDLDHIVELQISGPDKDVNLWPLNESDNRRAGSVLNTKLITYKDKNGNKVTKKFGELEKGKFYFVLKNSASGGQ
jgi:hypothetical protein